jgi:large subunit ribosomal protein L17
MHRHAYKGRKFSRTAGPRKALLKGLAAQVILHEKITTTLEKAKEVQPVVEKLITRAKSGTLNDRRVVGRILSLQDKSAEKLFAELGPLYKDRNGGYTRIVKLGNRVGDNANMAQIQLLDTEKLTKKAVIEEKKAKAVKTETKAPAEKVEAKSTKKPATKKAKETK